NLGPPINTDGNEGAQCISPDGQWIFMTACNRRDGEGSCDIYISHKTANGWSEPRNPKSPLNSAKWESQPGFSVDGKTLYFSSNRPGGKGGMDIWYSTFVTGKGWGEPKNLVIVNTPGNEQSPFIHPDDQTLYFSSNGLPGMGEADLFYCRRQPDGYWGIPQNLGYPINTPGDEQSLIVSATGDTAFISTDKKGGFGNLDIYSFALYPEARPQTVTYFKGKITDKDNRQPLEANFELIDIATGEIKARSSSTPGTGEFLVSLPMNRNYALNVSKDNYLFFSESFELKGSNSASKPVFKNVELSPIKAGEKVVLKNIFFDSNKFDLKSESNAELDKLVELLKKNPSMKIEISGHTDNIGNKTANKTLSENRAKSVIDFLISKGIESGRLVPKGYGDEKPIDSNETETGRANNRRTEMTIL
ncbi:MAG: OmpA family protein, partial [Bacteroidia bacterium]|nr:OmpA family protein [Bacteroidia bacterium]